MALVVVGADEVLGRNRDRFGRAAGFGRATLRRTPRWEQRLTYEQLVASRKVVAAAIRVASSAGMTTRSMIRLRGRSLRLTPRGAFGHAALEARLLDRRAAPAQQDNLEHPTSLVRLTGHAHKQPGLVSLRTVASESR